jgi:hypothetical protein
MAGLNVSPGYYQDSRGADGLPRKRADSMIEKLLKTVGMVAVYLACLGIMLLVPYD